MSLYPRAVASVLLVWFTLLAVGCNRDKGKGVLKVTGTVETTTVALSFKVPGRLLQRLVDEGQTVRAGQEVARLEETELREEQRARSAQERAARAALQDLEAGSRREEIGQAEAALARLRAEAVRAAEDAVRMEKLIRQEVVAQRDLDTARAARDASAAAVREAEERLRLLKAGPRPDAVQQARATLESAAASRALADSRLADAVLATPVSGQVLTKHAEPGEMLAAGSPVLTVGKLDEVWIRAYIPETELGRIKLGQRATVTSDTWPGKSYSGTVSFIAQQAEFTPKNVQTETERVKLVYRIKITVPNLSLELKPGMPVDALIQITP
ncbi:efflux RND transporter periplasmic adaptor subunit [Trichlorobacter ammonificans]|uniref:HlyD family secretion protein n=1 Tax=Trichlorobacter ammonificans TaxID=2916410 RepID=A0ABN8HMI8_9BACT|nr:HlyD family efflux transporter periplasmic adaptor subunit [Trichlorobacter ammonificans]CAH2032582.1 HlyD family secretion protein [Trichlorobacter ammonificans]